jgi:putative flippase GtrA
MDVTGWVTRERLAEIARFCAVGLGTFALDEGCLILLRNSTRMPLGIDTAIAYAVAALVNFIASRQWVFEQASEGARPRVALVRYVVVVVIGLLVTAALVPALQAAGIDYRIGKALASGVVGIANYFAFPLWVFRGKGAGAGTAVGTEKNAGTERNAEVGEAEVGEDGAQTAAAVASEASEVG